MGIQRKPYYDTYRILYWVQFMTIWRCTRYINLKEPSFPGAVYLTNEQCRWTFVRKVLVVYHNTHCPYIDNEQHCQWTFAIQVCSYKACASCSSKNDPNKDCHCWHVLTTSIAGRGLKTNSRAQGFSWPFANILLFVYEGISRVSIDMYNVGIRTPLTGGSPQQFLNTHIHITARQWFSLYSTVD